MSTKEKIKEEIDQLPDNLVEEVYEFINSIKSTKKRDIKRHTFKLKGKFDSINIREQAYE